MPKADFVCCRIGLGQDSHRFEKKRIKPLILGGVRISNTGGLAANSDGDVILHSLCNALSSAIGGDSLGTWADEMCLGRGIKDSREFVQYIYRRVKEKGYRIENLSVSIEAKRPYLSSKIIKKIKKQIAKLLEITPEQVGITFSSGEELTVFGKGKAIQTLTLVNLHKQ